MREFKVAGKTVRLNERDYRQLLERFDTAKAAPSTADKFYCRIDVRCICIWYHGCTRCPFSSAFDPLLGKIPCSEVLKKLHLYPKHVFITTNFQVSWRGSNNKAAVAEINKIHDALLSLERR